MNSSLESAARQYYSIVKSAYKEFVDYAKEQQSIEITCIPELYDFLRNSRKNIFAVGEKTYHFHGGGCSVLINDKQVIAWDFGYRSWLCGIDPYKMALTLSNNDCNLETSLTADQIEASCKAEVEKGNMTKHYSKYYINLLSLKTEPYSFPTEYDRLIIEQKKKRFEYDRTKVIDRFIRKSTKVYKCINELDHNWVLVFMKDNEEAGRYLYNDIAYPESAVRIMNELIKGESTHG